MKNPFLNRFIGLFASLSLAATPLYADTKISAMTDGGTVQTTDQIAAVRAGANVRVQVGAAAAQPLSAFLRPSNNLSDVSSVTAALNNLLPTQTGNSGRFLGSNGTVASWIALAASATTDTTNAANITSGTLPAARLPNPSASTLGGVQSSLAVSNQFLTGISTLGVPTRAQPAFTDLSGNIAVSQMNGGTGASSSTFWRGDGTWATPGGGGTVTTTGTPSTGQMAKFSGSTSITNAVAGTDYQAPITLTTSGTSGAATLIGNTLNIPQYSGGGGGGSGITRSINSVSVDTTAGSAALTDYVYLVTGTTTITLPTAVGNTNEYTVKRKGTGVVTVAFTGGQTADGNATVPINVQYSSYTFVSDGTNWNIK